METRENGATLVIRDEARVRHVRINRPSVRNAFDASLIRDLTRAFEDAGQDTRLEALVLSGEGPAFCAGADLHWMRAAAAFGPEENAADARALSRMFETLRDLPFLTVARVHGAALGGGGGLAATVDVAFAAENTRFGFTEVRLGIIPAVISPFVMQKIGAAHARRYFTTGELFDGRRAAAIGLVSEALPESELDGAVARLLDALRNAGPAASRAAKVLVKDVEGAGPDIHAQLALRIAAMRTSPEAREGMAAFLDKRPPDFRKDPT